MSAGLAIMLWRLLHDHEQEKKAAADAADRAARIAGVLGGPVETVGGKVDVGWIGVMMTTWLRIRLDHPGGVPDDLVDLNEDLSRRLFCTWAWLKRPEKEALMNELEANGIAFGPGGKRKFMEGLDSDTARVANAITADNKTDMPVAGEVRVK